MSNVAVIIDRVTFISSFLFYCLLFNHNFQTNSNKITNCFQLFSLYYNLQTTFAQCIAILIFLTLGFNVNEIQGVYRIVASILHLGNLVFQEVEGEEYASVEALNEKSKTSAVHAASLLQIDSQEMLTNISQKILHIRGR